MKDEICGVGGALKFLQCVKSVQIPSYFWSVFSCIRTEYGNLREYFWSVFSPNTGKYGPEITVYLDTFHAVLVSRDLIFSVNVAHAKYVTDPDAEEEREKKEKNGERKEIQTHKLEELDMQLSLHETNLQVAEEAIAEGNIKLKEALKDKKLSREKSQKSHAMNDIRKNALTKTL